MAVGSTQETQGAQPGRRKRMIPNTYSLALAACVALGGLAAPSLARADKAADKPAAKKATSRPTAKRATTPAAKGTQAAKPAKDAKAAAKPANAAAKPAARAVAARPAPAARPAATQKAPAAKAAARTAPTARAVARQAPPARTAPAATRTAPAARANAAAKPAAARTAPAARTAAKATTPPARAAARPAPAKTPARTAPAARTSDAAKAVSDAPLQLVTQTQYDMIFRGKKVGEYTRLERRKKDGTITVDNKSRLTIKMLFAKVTAVNSSHCEYDKSGRLTSFTITSTVRGKTTNYKGTQTDRGITITRWSGKKKTKPKFFAAAQYQGTSLDLRFPSAPSGVSFTRKYLIIPRMRIVSQDLRFREAPAGKVFGKVQPLTEMTIRNRRGSGILLLTRDGRMVASKMRGMLGRVEIRIKQGK